MSVERLQTVLQFSTQGADQVIQEINRVLAALRQSHGDTPFAALDPGTLRNIGAQRPQAFDKIKELQGQQFLAQGKLNDAIAREAGLRAKNAEPEKLAVAERATTAAAIRESKARRALAEELERFIKAPELAQRKEQEKRGAEIARQIVAEQKADLAERKRVRAEQESIGRYLSKLKREELGEQEAARRKAFVEQQQLGRILNRIRNEEIKAAEKAATAASRSLSQGEISQLVSTPVRQPGDSDKVHRARQKLHDAENAEAIARMNVAEAVRRASVGEGASKEALATAALRAATSHNTSTQRTEDAQRRLQTAIDTEAQAHARNTRSTIREDFLTGFKGRRGDSTIAEQMGQAFKFSVFYGAAYKLLFGITATMAATLQEGVEFQQAMTDLSIAAGKPKTELEDIARTLGDSAVEAGFAPSQGVQIGARALGLYGATDADFEAQKRIMASSADIVNQMAVGSDLTPVDLQTQIAAIAQGLGRGPTGQYWIADLDAYMSKRFGVGQGVSLEAVAQSASVGKAAGFTDEQLFGIAANMIARTGQTSSAVGGYMAQIFSRGGEGSLVDVAKKQGIDPNQQLSQIVEELSMLYQSASARDQAEISAAFGRGKIQNAAVALLGQYSDISDAAGDAQKGAQGAASDMFLKRMGDIGGQIAQLQGVLRDFASQLGSTGILDILGLGIIVFRELVEVVNNVLRLWNSMDRWMRDLLMATGLVILAFRTLAGTAIGRGVGSALSGVGGVGAAYTAGQAGAAAAGAGGVRAGAAGLAAAGRASLGLLGPIGLAIGGLVAIASIKASADKMRAAQDQATEVLLNPSSGWGSPSSQFSSDAAEMRAVAKQNRDATGFLLNFITLGFADNNRERQADQLDSEAARLEAIASRVALHERTTTPGTSVFNGTSESDLSQGLSALEAGGYSANQQLKALRDTLFGTAEAANAADRAFTVEAFSESAAGGALEAVAGGFEGFKATTYRQHGDYRQRYDLDPADLRTKLAEELSPEDMEGRLKDALNKRGVDSVKDLDPAKAEKVARTAAKGIADSILDGQWQKFAPQLQEQIDDAVLTYLLEETQAAPTRGKSLSREDATAAAEASRTLTEAALESLPEQGATQARIAELDAYRKDLKRLQKQARGTRPVARITQLLDEARSEIANTAIAEMEELRKIAQQSADSKKEIADVGREYLMKEIKAAVKHGNTEALGGILRNAGRYAVRLARNTIEEALDAIGAAIEVSDQLAEVGQAIDGVVRGAAADFRNVAEARIDAEGSNRRRNHRRKELKEALNSLDSILSATGDKDVYKTGSDSGNPLLDKAKDEKEKEEPDAPAQIAAARSSAFAVRSEGQIAAARAAIQQAKANLADAKKNTVEYWNAMGELFAAQNALTDAVQAYKVNKMRLGIDITNPLAEARLAVRAAEMKLRSDRGKGADVIAEDRVALQEARANREATAFSQRLQAVQTAEELGRISHGKYINYLENEKRRLEGIKNRTFQQQEQLDQIDRLMKDAAKTMEGQFNLGDIKLPTPYQVRRYIEQTSPARTERLAAASTTNHNFTMHVNGADVGVITKVVKEQVGKGSRVRTPAPRRRS